MILNCLNHLHSLNDSSKNYINPIHEWQWSQSDIKLAFICVSMSIFPAHSQHARLWMFNLKAFIIEKSWLKNRTWLMIWNIEMLFNIPSLNELSFNHPIKISVNIRNLSTILSSVTLTELSEILACYWTDIIKKLYLHNFCF